MYPYLHVFGRSIPSYGLCIAIGILISCYIGFTRIRRNNLDVNSMIAILACAIGIGLLGAKVLYLFASKDASSVFQRLIHGDISDLTTGGQVFYGGLIGGIAGALLGIRITGEKGKLAHFCDAIVPAIPIGHAFGRIGCFLGGCCYGAPYTGFGAMSFPKVGVNYPVFPIQLLEAVLNIGIFLVLIVFSRNRSQKGMLTFYLYLILYSVVRFILEFFRGDLIRGISHGLSTSQWISIGLFVCGAILITATIKRKARTEQ